ncbi:hypothetical protein L6164_028159 [Bauhinia variegata]|uniref:Uncharacterized protein n=1 Tax=Bauhinia variegata TaxID=167791 RepID=A0ACB9LWV3_BAUVA|nr:hypothetical protein L6164_028159 [Bauhinia variegata]
MLVKKTNFFDAPSFYNGPSLVKHAKIHGPIMCLKLDRVTTIVASSALMAKQVLSAHDQSLANRTVHDAYQL